jgi:hypothetical protein
MPGGHGQLSRKSEKELWVELLAGQAFASLLLGGVVGAMVTSPRASGPAWGPFAFVGVFLMMAVGMGSAYLAELGRRKSWVPPGARSRSRLAGGLYSLAFLAVVGGPIGLGAGLLNRFG